MPTGRIKTGLDRLIVLVNKKGEIKLTDAAKILDMDEEALNEFVKILVDHEIIEIKYSFVGDKILKRGPKIKGAISRKEIKEKVETITKKEPEKVDRLLGVIKKKIAEKKRVKARPREEERRRREEEERRRREEEERHL